MIMIKTHEEKPAVLPALVINREKRDALFKLMECNGMLMAILQRLASVPEAKEVSDWIVGHSRAFEEAVQLISRELPWFPIYDPAYEVAEGEFEFVQWERPFDLAACRVPCYTNFAAWREGELFISPFVGMTDREQFEEILWLQPVPYLAHHRLKLIDNDDELLVPADWVVEWVPGCKDEVAAIRERALAERKTAA